MFFERPTVLVKPLLDLYTLMKLLKDVFTAIPKYHYHCSYFYTHLMVYHLTIHPFKVVHLLKVLVHPWWDISFQALLNSNEY